MRLMAVMLPAVFVISGITKGDWLDALLFSLSVAVGLTPEMLPMLVTSCLAKGAVDLSHDKVIVKRLDAIQDLGAINVLCTEGFISLDELTERLRYRKLSDQYSFHTERACRLLTNEGPL